MELTEEQEEYREWLIGLILSARTLPQIIETRELLRKWVEEHPDDRGIVDGFDHLAMFEYIAELEEAERREPARQAA